MSAGNPITFTSTEFNNTRTFLNKLYMLCDEWTKHNMSRVGKFGNVFYTLQTLLFITEPKRTTAEFNPDEMKALFVFIKTIAKPYFMNDASDLWEEIDHLCLDYILHDVKTEETQCCVDDDDTFVTKFSDDDDDDAPSEKFLVSPIRKRPMFEIEDLTDEEDENEEQVKAQNNEQMQLPEDVTVLFSDSRMSDEKNEDRLFPISPSFVPPASDDTKEAKTVTYVTPDQRVKHRNPRNRPLVLRHKVLIFQDKPVKAGKRTYHKKK